MFKQRKVTPASFVEKNGDFPQLVSLCKPSSDSSLDFKTMMKDSLVVAKEEPTGIDYSKIPGWIVLSGDKKKIYKQESEYDSYNYNYHTMVLGHMYKMAQRWEQYKEDYIELHGEDEYYRVYNNTPDSYFDLLQEDE
jgi:hypothetical protein